MTVTEQRGFVIYRCIGFHTLSNKYIVEGNIYMIICLI